jgi:hypothetical protein
MFLLSADDVILRFFFKLSSPSLSIPYFKPPLGVWKLISDNYIRRYLPIKSISEEKSVAELRSYQYTLKTLLPTLPPRGATIGSGEVVSILPKPAAPTIAMPKSRPLPFWTLNGDGDGILEGDESSSEESMESLDENVEPKEGTEQPALELPIRLEADSSASADRMMNNLLELGSNRKLLLSLFAKSFKDSPVGDYSRLA